MADETPDSIQRWTAKRRVALVVSILKGETSVAAAARTSVLPQAIWQSRAETCSVTSLALIPSN